MADFMDTEAVESDDESTFDEEEKRIAAGIRKKKKAISSDEEEEDEDEEKAREEMKGFIIQDDEESVSQSSDDSNSDSGSSEQNLDRNKRGKKKKRHRRHHDHSNDEDDDDVDADDLELLEENLGYKIQKRRKRIRMGSSGSDSDDDHRPSDEEDGMDAEDNGAGTIGITEHQINDDLDDDDGGFIVDDDGNPIEAKKTKKKKHLFEDAAKQDAEDIFGVAFDFEEFEQYEDADDSEEEDVDEDIESDVDNLSDEERCRRKSRKKQRVDGKKGRPIKTIFDLFEPRELELRHFTDLDNEIRNTDIPERMQLRVIPITSVPDGSDELDREAEWIFKYGFIKPTVSRQEGFTPDVCLSWQRKNKTIDKIRNVLDYIRQQFLEVPFIMFYRKEYIRPELGINELWRIYLMDEQWCMLQTRKTNLRKLFQKMQNYQFEKYLDKGENLPIGFKTLTSDNLERIDSLESLEELKDMYQYFMLYYGRHVQAMQDFVNEKNQRGKKEKKIRNKEKLTSNKDDVTAEDEDETEDEDEQETLKLATRCDSYTLCHKFGLSGITQRFGLTAEQFGENLRDGYHRNQVKAEQCDPLKVGLEFVNKKFPNPESVINAAKFMMATEIAREPQVIKVVRENFMERMTFSVRPTVKGVKEIDEFDPCYTLKYLKDKPVKSLHSEQWLRLVNAEEMKLLEMDFAEDIPSLLIGSTRHHSLFIDDAKELYKDDGFSDLIKIWNQLRGDCIEMAMKKFIYPMLQKELRLKLAREAKDAIMRECQRKMSDWIKTAPYTVTFQEQDEDDWDSSMGCRVMAIGYDSPPTNIASYGVVLSPLGEVNEFLKLPNLLKRNLSWNERDRLDKNRDLDLLKDFILRRQPHCVAILAVDRLARMLQDDVTRIVEDLVHDETTQFPRIEVFLVDDSLAKVYANSRQADVEMRDYPFVLRQAISIARRLQDPLVEFSRLMDPERTILCLRFHPLQELLEEDQLLNAINIELVNRTNEVGVNINECVVQQQNNSAHLVQFVGGLGPRKGAALLKALRQLQSSHRLENRQQLVTLCNMGPKVFINCSGFIKIDTAKLGDTEAYVEVLDGSRIHNEYYEWARKMAADALEYDGADSNPANALEEILQEPEKLIELDLDAFAEELKRLGYGDKSITLYDIRAELHDMYKDLREPFALPTHEEVFNMITKETPATFYVGKLITAVVVDFVYKKPQGEELDQAAPLRKGDDNLWQCPFCGKDDFPELTEVWNHFDAGTCPGKAVGVKISLDNNITGFIHIKNLSDSAVINPEARVRRRQSIFCRILKINPERFSVECVSKSSALIDNDGEWKRTKDDYYDFLAEQRDIDKAASKRANEKRQTYIRRVIVHPSFYNINYQESVKLMSTMAQGDVIIRPSSKGADRLTVTWKVADNVSQHIDVREEGKPNAFSLGQSLWIGNEEFEDLDEIIARHINPMAAHARDILAFKYYRSADGGNREKAEDIIRAEKRMNPNKIHYILSASCEFPGKFLLSYIPRLNVRHEYVSVTPDSFRFRQQNFDSLSSLIRWLKEHFRDPLPLSTPVIQSGRQTSNTPYLTGTPGGITPGAMSITTGTPYGNVYNTPYTPSGQTPFMTPHNTPGIEKSSFPSPLPYNRLSSNNSPSVGRNRNHVTLPVTGWAAAAKAWASSTSRAVTPRNTVDNTPRGYNGSATPGEYDKFGRTPYDPFDEHPPIQVSPYIKSQASQRHTTTM